MFLINQPRNILGVPFISPDKSLKDVWDNLIFNGRRNLSVHKTIEFAPETFVDLDAKGDLIGIEMLNPAQIILKRIAKKFHHPELSKVHTRKLQAAIA